MHHVNARQHDRRIACGADRGCLGVGWLVVVIRHLKPPLATLDVLAFPAFRGAFDGSHGAAENGFEVGVERGMDVFSNKVHVDTHILSAIAVRATH